MCLIHFLKFNIYFKTFNVISYLKDESYDNLQNYYFLFIGGGGGLFV